MDESFDIRKLIRRLLIAPLGSEVMYGCGTVWGPCPPEVVPEQLHEDHSVSVEDVATVARASLCLDTCTRASGRRCADGFGVQGTPNHFLGPSLAPTSFPCFDGLADAGGPDAGRPDAGAEEPGAQEKITQFPVGDVKDLPAWKRLRWLAALTERARASEPAGSGNDCEDVCGASRGAGGATSTDWRCASSNPSGHIVCAHPEPSRTVESNCGAGRAPAGLEPLVAEGLLARDPVAHYWLQMQYLEAASVHAFRELADELAGHGAPRDLVARAERAADQEVVHAALSAAEVARHGLRPSLVRRTPSAPRTLLDLAHDNARAGCVSESFGALLAGHQAQRAPTEATRCLFAQIVEDETSHAELAWDIHAWVLPRLAPSDGAAVEATLREAADVLEFHEPQQADVDARGLAELGLADVMARSLLVREFASAIRARPAST